MKFAASQGSSRIETLISFSVIGLLFIVAGLVWRQQSVFDERLFMPATTAGAAQDSSTSAPASAAPSALASLLPDGFAVMGAAEEFDRDTLSDKIDGKAELYLPAGFQKLICQRMASKANPQDWLEVFVYDMEKPNNSFSVYSAQRRPDSRDSNVAPTAYSAGNAFFLSHGKFYVETVASESSPAIQTAMTEIAQKFVKTHAGESAELSALGLLPTEGRIPGSVQLVLENAFGSNKLNNLTLVDYLLDGTTVTAFISLRKDAQEAEQLAAGYASLMKEMGADVLETTSSAIPRVRMLDVLGDTEIIFSESNALAGVHAAKTRELGKQAALMIYNSIRGAKK